MKKIISICLTYIFVVSIIFQGISVKANAEEASKTSKPLKAITGQVVFKVKDVKNDGYIKILEKYEGKLLSKNGEDILAQVNNDKVENAIEDLQKDSNIEFAEVNALGKKQSGTDDKPSSANNSSSATGTTSSAAATAATAVATSASDYLNYSNAKEAWTLMPSAASQKQAIVAVVDSGVKASHPALTGKVLTNGYNFVGSNSATDDDNGHGTEVAGVIAANEVNGNNVSGVTGNANVKILPVKVLDKDGNGSSYNVAQGIKYAADHGASIINVSVVGEGYSKDIEDAVNYAQSKNVLIIASAGDYKDYAENYWPCNSEGVDVVSDINGGTATRSNFGKVITFGASSVGTSTTIDANGYANITGSSFSAAVVSGAAALASIKYPSYSMTQVESLMRNSVSSQGPNGAAYDHKYGYGIIDFYKLMNGQSSLIEIVSPSSGINSKGDVPLKIKAVTPANITKLEVYLNDSAAPLTTINGSNAASYSYTIPAANLVDGSNKIAVKAYSNSGSTYTDLRYIREYKTDDHQFTLKFTDVNGKSLEKGTRVYLQNGSNIQTVSDLTDDKGSVTFYNTNPNTNYNVFYSCDNVDANHINHPIFFKTQINSSSIPSVIDKSNLRIVNVSAKKPDNTPLLDSKLFYGSNGGEKYDDVFDNNGNGYIYVTDASNSNIRLVNEDEGYILDKTYPKGMYGVNSINFGEDNTVTKININNSSYSNINNQLFTVKGNNDYLNYKLPTVNVKNNAVYLSKGMDYKYYYEADINSNNNDYKYKYQVNSIQTNKNSIDINYGKPHVNINNYSQSSNSVLPLNLNISDDYNNSMVIQPNTNISFDLKDSSNNLIKEKKELISSETNTLYENFPMDSVVTGNYSLTGKADLGALGVIESTPLAINYSALGSGGSTGNTDNTDNTGSNNTNSIGVTIKPPASDMNNFNLMYQIYDNTNGNIVYNGTAVYSSVTNTAQTSIDKTYADSKYNIVITGYSGITSAKPFTFIYNRQLSSISASNLVIDNSGNNAKLLTVKTDDSSKQNVVQSGKLNISLDKYPKIMKNAPLPYFIGIGGNTSIYIDKGNYHFEVQNDNLHYWIGNEVSITDSNSTAVISTNNLAKISVNASNIKNFTNANLHMRDAVINDMFTIYTYMNLPKGSVFYVSPSLNVTLSDFSTQAFDMASGKSIMYNYTGNSTVLNKDLNINLSDFTFKFSNTTTNVTLPAGISASYNITAGGYSLNYISSSDSYNFMNEIKSYKSMYVNILDSNNKLVSTIDNNYSDSYINSYYTQLSNLALSSGKYTAAIVIPNSAVNISGNTFNFNVDSSNIEKIKIMNPFDSTKPAYKAKVVVKGDFTTYYSDVNGYVYVNKANISSPSDITISVDSLDGSSSAIYSPDTIAADSSGVINVNKSISALSKMHIKAVDPSNSIDFANAEFSISSAAISSGISLNYNGEKYVYLPNGNYNINSDSSKNSYVSDKGYILSQGVNLNGNVDVILDTSKMGNIKVNSNGENYYSMYLQYSDNGGGSAYIDSYDVVYVSPGLKINYGYQLNPTLSLGGSGSFTTAANTTNTINIGKNYTVSASIDKTTFSPTDSISASINIADEYKNNISTNPYLIQAVISQNGNEVDRINCSNVNNNKYLFDLDGAVAGNANVHFEINLGDFGKKVTTDIPINISTEGYYVLNITDPLGKPADGATVQVGKLYEGSNYLSQSFNGNANKTGKIYINKSSLNGSENKIIISGYTADTHEPFVYYRDFSTNVTDYKATNTAKTNVVTSVNDGSNPNSLGLELYSGNVNLISWHEYNSQWGNYNNFNLYLDKGVYSIKYNLQYYSYGNNADLNYSLYKDNVDSSADNKIIFDKSNISKIVPVYDGTLNGSNPTLTFRTNGGISDYLNYYSNNYISKMTYPEIDANITLNSSSGYYSVLNFTKKNFNVKDDITEVHFGKGLSNATPVYGVGIPSNMTVGDNISPLYSMADIYGFSTDLYGNYKVNFSNNGILVDSLNSSIMNSNITVPELPEGFYDVDVYYGDLSQGGIKIMSKKVYVAANNSSYKNVLNYSLGYNINIFDKNNFIYNLYSQNNDVIPGSLLDTSKIYTTYVSKEDYNSIISYYGTLGYDSDNKGWRLNEPDDLVWFNITNAKGMTVKLTDKNGNLAATSADSNGNIQVSVQPGNYNLSFSGTGADGKYYLFDKTLNVTDSTTDYNVDYSNLSKLTINSGYSSPSYYGNYTFINTDGSTKGYVNDTDIPNGVVYIDKGSYNVGVNKNLQGVNNTLTGNYAVDCTGDTSNLVLGSKLTTNVKLDKTSYNAGDTTAIGSLSLADNGIALSGLSSNDFTITSIDVMHGNKVIKSFNGAIPSYLKGECEMRVNVKNGVLGNISSNIQAVNINNNSPILDGDINLDGIVDIFDLVLLSKDMGKTKVVSGDWDGRCNLDNSDNLNKIDIKDVAKAAQNYNKRN